MARIFFEGVEVGVDATVKEVAPGELDAMMDTAVGELAADDEGANGDVFGEVPTCDEDSARLGVDGGEPDGNS